VASEVIAFAKPQEADFDDEKMSQNKDSRPFNRKKRVLKTAHRPRTKTLSQTQEARQNFQPPAFQSFVNTSGGSPFNPSFDSPFDSPFDTNNGFIELPLQMVSRRTDPVLDPMDPNLDPVLDPMTSFPLNAQEEFAHAQIYASLNRWAKALHCYQNVTELAPHSIQSRLAHHHSARIQSQVGNRQKAMRLYETLLLNWPHYIHLDQVLWESGNLYIDERKWPNAFEKFQQLHDQFPSHRQKTLPKIQYVKDRL